MWLQKLWPTPVLERAGAAQKHYRRAGGEYADGRILRASAMRLRWPYVDALSNLRWHGKVGFSKQTVFLEKLEPEYKAPFEPVGEESLAGSLSTPLPAGSATISI